MKFEVKLIKIHEFRVIKNGHILYFLDLWCVCLQAHTPQVQKITLPNTDYAHKNITSNFSQARSTIPEDGSQRSETCRSF